MLRSIKKIYVSIGREVGGVTSFSLSLGEGMRDLGYEVVYFKPSELFKYFSELKKEENLKILSTTAVFFAPFFKNSICVAHGFPRINGQGIVKWLGIVTSFYIGSRFGKMVAVSHYAKNHLAAFLNIACKHVIYNPLRNGFLSSNTQERPRHYLTYVGRLHPVKNISSFIEPLKKIMNQYPQFEVLIIGSGSDAQKIKETIDERFHLVDHMDENALIDVLQQTKVFFSGCETEALGVSFLEALACGSSLVMPLSGGGLEIDTSLLGRGVFTFHPNFSDIEKALKDAILFDGPINFRSNNFSAATIAKEYIEASQNG